jgi:hypothetical protein
MVKYAKFVDSDFSYKELKRLLEQELERGLTELEDRKIKWFADCEYETVGVFFDIFKEISKNN